MSRMNKNPYIIGKDMGLKNSYEWSIEYIPLFANLTLWLDPQLSTIVYQMDTADVGNFITVSGQVVQLAINGDTPSIEGAFPLFSTLTAGRYYYALDFKQLITDDTEFRIQGELHITNEGGNVQAGNENSIVLSLGNATCTVIEV